MASETVKPGSLHGWAMVWTLLGIFIGGSVPDPHGGYKKTIIF
jgi:hypothetical protein